jgi:hypothetical protein
VGPLRIADVGSGAGFPGVPVAVLRPESRITLIESHQRKAVFLKEACRTLANVSVAAKRAEDVAECFDWAISRAVSWEELERVGSKLAAHVGFLGTESLTVLGAKSLRLRPVRGLRLPWDEHRNLILVSRET